MARYNYNFGTVNEYRQIRYSPSPLVINGKNVWTNISDVYIKQGYYPIEETEKPIKEGFYFTSYWEVEDNKCLMKWEEHEIIKPDIPIIEDTVTEAELQATIQEGVNSIDS